MEGLMVSLAGLISYAIRIYTLIIIVRAVISWVNPDPYNPIVRILYRLTEPVLHPIRNVLMKWTGHMGIDFSPFIAIILLDVFRRILIKILLF